MGKYGNDDEPIFTIGGEVEAGAKTAESVPMPQGITRDSSRPAIQGHALVGPTLNFQTENSGPIRVSLLGGIGGNAGYLNASSNVTWGYTINAGENPTDPKSQETNRKLQISDNAAVLMGKVAVSYNQDGWIDKGLNGSVFATGTHALGAESALPSINTAQVGGDVGFNANIGRRKDCHENANYFNAGVGAQTTIFSSLPNDPNLNKVSISPYVGLSSVETSGRTLYGKVGADYTPSNGAVIPTVKLGVKF